MKPTVYDCSFVELPKVEIREGNITALNGGVDLPFDIKRVFYTYDIPGGVTRGGHAHRNCHEFLSASVYSGHPPCCCRMICIWKGNISPRRSMSSTTPRRS